MYTRNYSATDARAVSEATNYYVNGLFSKFEPAYQLGTPQLDLDDVRALFWPPDLRAPMEAASSFLGFTEWSTHLPYEAPLGRSTFEDDALAFTPPLQGSVRVGLNVRAITSPYAPLLPPENASPEWVLLSEDPSDPRYPERYANFLYIVDAMTTAKMRVRVAVSVIAWMLGSGLITPAQARARLPILFELVTRARDELDKDAYARPHIARWISASEKKDKEDPWGPMPAGMTNEKLKRLDSWLVSVLMVCDALRASGASKITEPTSDVVSVQVGPDYSVLNLPSREVLR